MGGEVSMRALEEHLEECNKQAIIQSLETGGVYAVVQTKILAAKQLCGKAKTAS